MSVVVRKAVESDIDPVVDLLFDNMSRKVPKERWRRLLDYPWRPADADRGCVAVDRGRAVGFLGLVYADRDFGGGRRARTCNICAWYLLKEYRGQGIGQRIQQVSVADPALTYTIMTATLATGRAFSENSGFGVLDESRWIIRRRRGGRGAIELTDDPDSIAGKLSAGDRKILQDHRPYNVRHLLAQRGETECYLVFQLKRKGDDIDYHEVMYASDRRFLAENAQRIADEIIPSDAVVFAIDRRFVPDAGFETERLRLPRVYRSPTLQPGEIDHLYGEIVLLDLKL